MSKTNEQNEGLPVIPNLAFITLLLNVHKTRDSYANDDIQQLHHRPMMICSIYFLKR